MAAAAVNWLCLVVLAFVFINENVCIKVDTNLTNGNYTTININSHQQTLQQQEHKSSNSNNEPDNLTLLGDSELSASERTRRLIPYMAFYVPVAELPINKQYANIQTTKQQVATRPSAAATGSTGPSASHIPLPQQYVHLKVTATGTGHSSSGGESYLPPATVGHYPPSAGDVYHSLTYGGHHQQHPQQHQQQSQFHILPTTSNIKQIDGSGGGNNKYPGHAHHVLPSGPPGPSASSSTVGKGNSNNAFVTYKDINPIRHKTVQYFPPLSSTSSTSSVAASSSAYETIRHQQQLQQQQHLHGISGGVYRPRTKQSKINLTPFTPSNTVPGNFVPIVYTPVNSNNPSNSNNNYQSNNNVITTATQQTAGVANDDTAIILNEDEKQYHKQQQQQIAIEYSSGPLPPPSSAIDVQQTSSLLPPHRYNPNHHHHQQQHHTPPHHNPKQQSQQYFSVTTSPLTAANVDLTHEEGASGNAAVNAQHHHHHHPQQHNAQTIGPSTPQYIDYLIDEPKQSLDDEQNVPQHQQQQHHQQHHQLETLKPTLGPPSHAFILVSTGAPFVHDANAQENYGSTLRPPYKNKPKIRLQPVLKEKNVNYAPTEKPQKQQVVVSITPTPNAIINNDDDSHDDDEDTKTKYVYVKQEFGQKLAGAVKLKPSNKYESDNQITHRQQHQQHNTPLQALAPRPATSTNSDKGQHYQQHQSTAEVELESIQQPLPPKSILADPNELPDIRTSSLAEILHKLQESNHLPHTLTPDNIDNSIKTLIRILNNLKQTQTIVANPPQHHEATPPHASSPDYDYTTGSEEQQQQHQPEQHRPLEHPSSNDLSLLSPPPVNGPNKHPGPSTGRPGIDYPNYAEIPQTSFDCSQQRYKGFFGDPETNCQVWHYCDLNGGKASFLCPNGTIFSQIALTCDWWFNVKCGTTTQLYVLNERLYKYILPFTPKFPEDYSGPLVDKYLAMKFQEMEEKMRLEKEKVLQEEAEAATEPLEQHSETTSEDSKEDNHLEETTTEDTNSNNRHLKSPPPAPPNPMIQKHESVNSQVSEQSSERNLLIDDEVDDISQRGTIDTFDSTTIATMTATVQPERVSFNLKPIIVSSTIGPDYDDEQLQQQHHHQEDKRRHEKQVDDLQIQKTDDNIQQNVKEETVNTLSGNKMQITVEKVNVIEIKPDGATGHLIRDMLLNTNNKK